MTSKTIAGLIGPAFLAVATGLLLNLGSISAVLEPLSRDPALVLIYGIFLFVAGLAIVRFQNRWEANWSVLVTILGWLLVVGGLVRILFPLRFAAATGDFAIGDPRKRLHRQSRTKERPAASTLSLSCRPAQRICDYSQCASTEGMCHDGRTRKERPSPC